MMSSLIAVLILGLCALLKVDAFRSLGYTSISRRVYFGGTSPLPLKGFGRYATHTRKFSEVLYEVERKYGKEVFKYDNALNDAISALQVSKEHAEKLKDFQGRLRGEFSYRPGDMPTAIIDPWANGISWAVKGAIYVGLYYFVEAAVKNILLWTNADKRIKRATIVQQTKDNLKAQAVKDLLLKLEMTTKKKDKELFLKELSDLDPDGSIQRMLTEAAEQEQSWQ